MPIPSSLVVKNGSKIAFSLSDGTPGPESVIEIFADASSTDVLLVYLAPSIGCADHRVHTIYDQVQDDLLQLNAVPAHAQRPVNRPAIQLDIARFGLHRKKFKHLTNRFVEIDILRLDCRLPEQATQPPYDLGRSLVVAPDLIDNRLDLSQVR